MMKVSYTKLSNIFKILLLIAGGALALLNDNLSRSETILLISAIAYIAISGMLITLVDKVHKLFDTKLNALQEILKSNLDYHGIVDAAKDKFTPLEMQELWPLLMLRVKNEFIAVNYLSKEAWDEGGGDSLVSLLGIRMEIERIDARRIFVIENNQEYNEWEETFDLHHRCNFQARYILLKDYNRILKDLSKGSCELTNVKGFNIIDSGIIDIVVNWNYRNRSTDGATIKKGLGVSNEFTKLFNTLWRSAKEIEKRPKLERSKDLDLSYEKV